MNGCARANMGRRWNRVWGKYGVVNVCIVPKGIEFYDAPSP